MPDMLPLSSGLLRVPDAICSRKDHKVNILMSLAIVHVESRVYIRDNLGGQGLHHHETTGQDGVIGRVIIDKEDIIP